MAYYVTSDDTLTSLADAIREKGGTSDPLEFPDEFISAVDAISTELPTQTKSATPTESQQTIEPDEGYTLSSVSVGAIDSNYVGSGITRRSSTDLTVIGATVTAPAGYYSTSAPKAVASGSATTPATTVTANPSISVNSSGLITSIVSGSKSVTPTVSAGYVSSGTAGTVSASGFNTSQLPTQAAKTVTPTESAQTAVTAGKYTTGEVTVAAIPSDYVGSGIDQRSSTDLTVSGATVTAPAGYYGSSASKSVASGSVTMPIYALDTTPMLSVSNNGLITATVSGSMSVAPDVVEGYVTSGGSGTVSVSGSNTSQLSTQAAKTVTPTESAQTAVAAGKYTTGAVTVGAIPSDYVGSGIDQRSSSDLTVSGATVTAPAGYYSESASKSVATGTAGTPTATKGTVSNHTISVTPSVTNTTGYITGGTETGTAVTVSASELVSGTKSITTNGTGIDVANYSTVDVAVSGDVPVYQAKTGIVPTENSQTITADTGYDALSSVQIDAIDSDYVGSGIDRRDDSDLTASGATVTVPAGYYADTETKSVASGSATTPATTVTANPSISVSNSGLITATASATKSVTPTVSAGYVSSGTAGTITVSGSNTQQLSTQSGMTITPTESEQTAVAAGKYTLGAVKVGAISSTYVGSEIERRDDTDLSASGATITVPSGYYEDTETKTIASGSVTAPASISGSSATVSTGTNTLTLSKTVSVTPNVTTAGYISSGTAGNSSISLTASVNTISSSDLSVSGDTVTAPPGYYSSSASASVASGTEGTPTATKGTVSNHSVTVTPSVTNTTGYITGSTKTGTAVTVSASELVSGSETKTSNGTYDVTNLAELVVNVSGGGGTGLVYETGTYTPTSNIVRPEISFANTHTEAPILIAITDQSSASSITSSSNILFCYFDPYKAFGNGYPTSTSDTMYAIIYYSYRGSSSFSSIGSGISHNSDDTGDSSSSYPRYFATSISFKPYTNSNSRYWRSGRTYKWIAVWKPTS